MPKTKKTVKEVSGNTVEQRLQDTKFYAEFQEWLKLPDGAIDFLRKHGVGNPKFKRRGPNSVSPTEGHQKYFPKLVDIMEFGEDFIGDKEIEFLKAYKKFIEEAKGTRLDPAKMPYHDKVYGKDGKVKRKRPVWGHFATESYMKKYPDYPNPAKRSWYTYNSGELAQNPPHMALYSKSSPKGLVFILEDAIKELDDAEIDIVIRNVPNPAELFKISQVRQFFESKMNGSYFKEGMIRANAIRNDLKGQKFTVSNEEEETVVRRLAKVSRDEVAGDIVEFTIVVSPSVIERAYLGTNKRKVGGYYIHGKVVDKRPRKEGQPVAKSWLEILQGVGK